MLVPWTVAGFGGVHQSHIRDEGDYSTGFVASVDEVIEMAERTRTRGVVSHMKALGAASWGLAGGAVDRIAAARRPGLQVFADQYPYDASSTSLTGAIVPRWAQAGGTAEMRRRFGAHIRPLVATRADDPRAQESLIQAHDDDPDCHWIVIEDLVRLLPQPMVTLERAPTTSTCSRAARRGSSTAPTHRRD